MKAIVTYPPQKNSAVVADIPAPEPGRGEALLKILEVGIDGTDREIYRGEYGTPPEGCEYLVVGHEAVARIEKLGSDFAGFERGDLVVPTVRRPDGCVNCRSGEPDMCSEGNYREHGIYRLHGFASEYATTDGRFLVKVPEDLLETAVLLEPLSIAEKAVQQCFLIQRRLVWEPKSALVTGAGPLGLLAGALLRLKDLEVHVAATRSEESLKARLAESIGARYVNVRKTPISSLQAGFDLVVEATGSVEPAIGAMGLLRRNGVMVVLGNYPPQEGCSNFGRILREMVLGNRLVFGSVNSSKQHFERGVADMKHIRSRWRGFLGSMITKRLGLEEFEAAFHPDREDVKTVIALS